MSLPLQTALPLGGEPALIRRRRRRISMVMLCGPALIALIVFFALPLLGNAFFSFGISDIVGTHSAFTLENYRRLLTDSYYLGVIGETVKVSAITTVFCLLFGYPVAYYMVRLANRSAFPLLLVLVTPLLTSIIMRTFGWRVLLARHGLVSELLMSLGLSSHPLNILGSATIVYIGCVHVMLPFMVLSIVPVLRGVDPRLEESARICGAGAIKTFSLITLPLSIEGVITGCILVFMITNGSFVTMLLLGQGSVVTLPLLVFQQFSQAQSLGFASAMGNILLLLVLICLFLQMRLTTKTAE